MLTSPNERKLVEPEVAYDAYAARYDKLLEENRINAYMREAMLRIQRETFSPGERLLELGAGTGDEALALAALGCEIVASDPSAEMVRVAREKANTHPAGQRVTFLECHARNLGEALREEPDGSFGGAYSSFALSYEPALGSVQGALARLLRPGSYFLLAAVNRVCLSELLIATVALRPSLAGRRLRTSSPHKVGRVRTRIFCRTPLELSRSFRPQFAQDRIWALPAILPPHYMNRPFERWPSLVDILERVDLLVRSKPLFRTLGDHTVIRLRRVG